MPGYGYRILRQQPLTASQRVANIILDLRDRIKSIEQTRPGFSVSDVDPTVETPPYGFMHLNTITGRVWFYTPNGWTTADSRHYYGFDATASVMNTNAFSDLGPSLQFTVPPGAGFVTVFAGAELAADAIGTTVEVALNDGGAIYADFPIMRTSAAAVGVFKKMTTVPGSSVGNFQPNGGGLVTRYAPGTYTLKLRVRNFSANGINVRTQRRFLYVVVL